MELRGLLRSSVGALQLRGLKNSAKWAAELLAGLSPDAGSTAVPPEAELLLGVGLGPQDCSDAFLLAKTYFDTGEFQRCAFALQPPASPSVVGPSKLRGLSPEEVRPFNLHS